MRQVYWVNVYRGRYPDCLGYHCASRALAESTEAGYGAILRLKVTLK